MNFHTMVLYNVLKVKLVAGFMQVLIQLIYQCTVCKLVVCTVCMVLFINYSVNGSSSYFNIISV